MQLGTAYLIRTHTFGVWQLSLGAYSTYSASSHTSLLAKADPTLVINDGDMHGLFSFS